MVLNIKARVAAIVVLLTVRTRCEEDMILNVYEMYGSPVSEKTIVESNMVLRYDGNVSLQTLCAFRRLGSPIFTFLCWTVYSVC